MVWEGACGGNGAKTRMAPRWTRLTVGRRAMANGIDAYAPMKVKGWGESGLSGPGVVIEPD